MTNKVSITVRNNYPKEFGGAYVYAFIELSRTHNYESALCGNPNLTLMYWSADNRVHLILGDDDDMDWVMVYKPQNSAEAVFVFYKLMGFLESVADTVFDPDELLDNVHSKTFFPVIDGVKMMWEWEEGL